MCKSCCAVECCRITDAAPCVFLRVSCGSLSTQVFNEKTPLDDDAKPSDSMSKGLTDKLNWMKVRSQAACQHRTKTAQLHQPATGMCSVLFALRLMRRLPWIVC